MQHQQIKRGTKILAAGGLWTVTGCGNGMYTVRCEASKRSYSMPCADLQSDLADGKAFIANDSAYKQHETAAGYRAVLRDAQAIGEIHSRSRS